MFVGKIKLNSEIDDNEKQTIPNLKLPMKIFCKCRYNPFEPSVTFYIETSHLICTAYGFYMKCITWLKWVNFF